MKRLLTCSAWSILLVSLLATGCAVLDKSAKYELGDNFYVEKTDSLRRTAYIAVVDEVLRIYPTARHGSRLVVDSTATCQFYPLLVRPDEDVRAAFSRHSLDVDFLTMPLKLRPTKGNVPAQLNATINGALYLGYRTDSYRLGYLPTPLNVSERSIDHFGFPPGPSQASAAPSCRPPTRAAGCRMSTTASSGARAWPPFLP